MRWFVFLDSNKLGPYTTQELREKVARGEILPDVLITREGSPVKRRLAEILPELAAASLESPPVPPKPVTRKNQILGAPPPPPQSSRVPSRQEPGELARKQDVAPRLPPPPLQNAQEAPARIDPPAVPWMRDRVNSTAVRNTNARGPRGARGSRRAEPSFLPRDRRGRVDDRFLLLAAIFLFLAASLMALAIFGSGKSSGPGGGRERVAQEGRDGENLAYRSPYTSAPQRAPAQGPAQGKDFARGNNSTQGNNAGTASGTVVFDGSGVGMIPASSFTPTPAARRTPRPRPVPKSAVQTAPQPRRTPRPVERPQAKVQARPKALPAAARRPSPPAARRNESLPKSWPRPVLTTLSQVNAKPFQQVSVDKLSVIAFPLGCAPCQIQARLADGGKLTLVSPTDAPWAQARKGGRGGGEVAVTGLARSTSAGETSILVRAAVAR